MRHQPPAGRERSRDDEQSALAPLDDGAVARERRLARVRWHPNGQLKEQLLLHERELHEAPPPTLVPSDYPPVPRDEMSARDAALLLLAIATAGGGGWLGWQVDGPWSSAFGAAAGLLVATTLTAGAGTLRDRARALLHLVLAVAAVACATALGAMIGGPALELGLFLASLASAIMLVPKE